MKLMLKRAFAYAIDLICVYCILSIFLFAYRVFLLDPETIYRANYMLLCAVLSIGFLCMYLPTKHNGQTIGKVLLHLQVVNNNGANRSMFQNLLRECVLKFSFIAIFIPINVIYSIIESIKQRKLQLVMAHDILLNTNVCQKEG